MIMPIFCQGLEMLVTECMEQNKELSRITLIKILGPPRARAHLAVGEG